MCWSRSSRALAKSFMPSDAAYSLRYVSSSACDISLRSCGLLAAGAAAGAGASLMKAAMAAAGTTSRSPSSSRSQPPYFW
eukprot:5993762-Prymnesium_polylepis.1